MITSIDLFMLRKNLEDWYNGAEKDGADYALLKYIKEGINLADRLEDWLAGVEKEGR